MSRNLTPIEIRSIPDLVRLVEEVAETQTPRKLTKNKKLVAVLSPAPPPKKRAATEADYDASLVAIGSWRDLDPDALITQVYRVREERSRPATRRPKSL